MSVGNARSQSLALARASLQPRHVGGGPRLVDEDEALRIEIELVVEPLSAPLQDVGPVLLGRVR